MDALHGAAAPARFSDPSGEPITVGAYWGMTGLLLNLPRWAGAAEATVPRSLLAPAAG
jgi:hypothetical protein